MAGKHFFRILDQIQRRVALALTEQRTRHGIALSMYVEAAPLKTSELWPKLETALDLIAAHRPVWIRRMVQLDNSVHVRRIPGTRAMLTEGRFTILDPYLLADFLPAQIAASIVHEATHAKLYASGRNYDPGAPSRDELACRRAEIRFGRALRAAGVEGAEAVLRRAEGARALGNDVGVVINQEELRAIALVTRLKDVPIPLWCKRYIARRIGVLNSAIGTAAFGAKRKP